MSPKIPEHNHQQRPVTQMLAILRHPAVRAALDGLEQNRPVAAVLVMALCTLLVLAGSSLGGRLPSFPNGKYPIIGAVVDVPLEHVESLLSVSTWPQIVSANGNSSPFFTTYFQPPPPPPPLTPPTTRKVDLVYQGFFETPVGDRHAFVKVGEALVVGPAGTRVVSDLAVKEMDLRALTMTNQSAQASVLEFNQRKTIEVPTP
jgi:hypothetical protein